jgi:hypothetical protein
MRWCEYKALRWCECNGSPYARNRDRTKVVELRSEVTPATKVSPIRRPQNADSPLKNVMWGTGETWPVAPQRCQILSLRRSMSGVERLVQNCLRGHRRSHEALAKESYFRLRSTRCRILQYCGPQASSDGGAPIQSLCTAAVSCRCLLVTNEFLPVIVIGGSFKCEVEARARYYIK